MTAGTHLAFAGLIGVIGQGFGQPLTPELAGTLAIGSLLPDVDTTTSGLGKFAGPLSSTLERRLGHRTLTHSLLGTALVGMLALPLYFSSPVAWLYLLLGYLSHLFLDHCNVTGVPLLWPSRLQFWLFPSRSWRMPYGSPHEATLAITLALAGIGLFPLSQEGFTPLFHRWLGDPAGAVSDYLRWRDHYQVYADIKGFNGINQHLVKGRYLILAATGSSGLLVADEAGHVMAVANAPDAAVTTNRIHAVKGKPISAKSYTVELQGRTIGDLLASLPKNTTHTLITAELTLTQPVPSPPPQVGYYPRITVNATHLSFHSARPQDLLPYRRAYIREGSAIIRAEFSPDTTPAPTLNLAPISPAPKLHTLTIPNLPTLAGLIVKPGDKVKQGQPIARYVNDAAVKAQEAKVNQAKLTLKDTQAQLTSLQQSWPQQQKTLQRKVGEAQQHLKKMKFLVTNGAEPRAKLTQAQQTLETARTNQLTALSSYTSHKAQLERDLQSAQLTISSAKQAKTSTLNAQWVRSPLSGTIADIRVKSMDARGVTLEVVLLRSFSSNQ